MLGSAGGCGDGGCPPNRRYQGYRTCEYENAPGTFYDAPVCAEDATCGGATNTPRPTNTPAAGDGGNGGGSNPTNTPVPQGTVRARAVAVTADDTSCSTIESSTNFLSGTRFTITGQSQQIQNGPQFATWASINAGTYVLSATFPNNFGLARGCWNRTVTVPTSGEGMGARFTTEGEILTWTVGAVPPGAWMQTRGGDVYAAGTVQSLIPSTASPSRVFSLDGSGGAPGVLRYGGAFDFQIDAGSGEAYISSTNWNVNTTDRYATDYYDLMWRKFGGPTTVDFDAEALAAPLTQPISRETPYVAVGDVATSGNWVVPTGEKLILFVDGDLTINGRITTTGTGFFAAIVKGNITVASGVGTTYNSTTPTLKGVFITSPSGTFSTGASVVGTERFVGEGVFVAGSFVLQRSLAVVGQNAVYAAEYFLYDPAILFTLPDEMMETATTWSEVSP